MQKTLRIFGLVAVVLVVIVGAGLLYLTSNLDRIVAGLIEEQGSAATGTPVRVGAVSIDLGEAAGSISGLTVANPPGFGRDAAIEFGNLSMQLDAGSLFSDPIVVESIEVTDAVLRIEQLGKDNNLQALLANLQGNAVDEPAETESAAQRVVIRRFALAGASGTLSAPDFDEERSIEVPDIVLTDVGGKSKGATGAELARQILEPVVRRTLQSSAAQAIEQRVGEEISEKAGEIAGGLLNRLGVGGNDNAEEDPPQR